MLSPLSDRIVVKADAVPEKTEGGLIVPATQTSKYAICIGTVQTAFTQYTHPTTGAVIKAQVRAGDRVLWTKFAGGAIKLNGEELIILRESDVVAILGKDDVVA